MAASNGKWDDPNDIIHGVTESGRKVTVKYSKDGNDALVARGHVDDIQKDVDHAHAWNQKSGVPDHHDQRRGRKIFPGNEDKFDEIRATKDALIARAQQLSASTNWKAGGEEFRSLRSQLNAAGKGRPDSDQQQRDQFNSAYDAFVRARTAWFDKKDRESAEAIRVKERLVSAAEGLRYSTDLRAAGDKMRSLADEWRAAPRGKKDDEDRLWARFNAARGALNAKRDEERKKRGADEARAKAAKQAIISSAQSLSHSSDLRAARDEMRRLQERWKSAGRASRTDEDSLYKQFKAAQDALFQRAKTESAQREQTQAAAARTKESIIAQIRSLVSTSDFRSATDQVKALSDQYFQAGSAGRENERLKAAFQSAKSSFFDAKKREGDRKKAEWEANKRTRIAEMEQRVREMESRVAQSRLQLQNAYSQLSQTRSRPQPSWSNPHRSEIMSRQYDREQRSQQRISQIEARIYSMEAKVVTLRQKLSQLYSR